jgi:hypothetical protein
MTESTLNEQLYAAGKDSSSGLRVLLGLIIPVHEEQHMVTKLLI